MLGVGGSRVKFCKRKLLQNNALQIFGLVTCNPLKQGFDGLSRDVLTTLEASRSQREIAIDVVHHQPTCTEFAETCKQLARGRCVTANLDGQHFIFLDFDMIAEDT